MYLKNNHNTQLCKALRHHSQSHIKSFTYIYNLYITKYKLTTYNYDIISNKIPKMTDGADNSLVNFIILAESVALAPIVDFSTSLVALSLVEVDVFNLLLSESVFVWLLMRASFYVKQLWRSKILKICISFYILYL